MSLALIALGVLGSVSATLANDAAIQRRDQQFRPPRGQVENVTFRQVGGGVIEIRYDLLSEDPSAVFEVTVDVSLDAGETFGHRPKSATGDVGPGVKPGSGKRIGWEAAKEVEILEIDRFRFRVVAQAGRATPADATGILVVTSAPSGAMVFLDGEIRGDTPLTVTGLAAGAHRVVVRRDGYLENSRTISLNLEAGGKQVVEVTLTPEQPRAPESRGVNALRWIIPVAGGAAGAAVAAATIGGGEEGPVTETLMGTINTASTCGSVGRLISLDFCVGFERTTTQGGAVSATLTWGDPAVDLDLFVVDLDAGSIIASSRAPSGTFESLSTYVKAGQRYRVDLVEQRSGALRPVSFILSLTRPR